MVNNLNIHDDEIDLREVFGVLVRRKKMIIAIFLLSVLGAVIISFFQPKTYQATASVMITPSRLYDMLSPAGVALDVDRKASGEYLTRRPTLSLATHQTLMTSNEIFKRVIDRAQLTNEKGELLGSLSLKDKLSVEEIKNTNVLEMHVKSYDPLKATDIANAWASEYMLYTQELIAGEVKGAGEFIVDQFLIAKENLDQAERKVKEFKDAYLLDLMRAELDIKKSKLNDHKRELIGLDIEIRSKQDNLMYLREQIADQERFILISKAITDDALWQQEGARRGLLALQDKKLQTEIINPIYQDFEKRIVNTQIELNTLNKKAGYLREPQKQLEQDIERLGRVLNEKTLELTQLDRQVDIYKRTYNNLSSKIEDARIAKAAQLGEIRLASPAYEPQKPVGPKKKRIVGIAGFLGLFSGIFLAFVADFLQKDKKSI